MALMKCPECGGQISDQAESCPHCGYVIRKSTPQPETIPASCQINPTLIGGTTEDKAKGALVFIVAVILIIISVFTLLLISIFWGIILLAISVFVTKESVFLYEKKNSVECPYCGRLGQLPVSEGIYKCKYCKKRSARKNGYLNPIL